MLQEISYETIQNMLTCASEEVMARKDYLSELDSAIGDGDHGTSISRAMECMTDILEKHDNTDIKALLKAVGWGLLGINGGATGPLMGSLFKGLSDGIESGTTVSGSDVAAMFAKSKEAVLKVSGASLGDKTMIDAFLPAVDVIISGGSEADLVELFQNASVSADTGAESTIDMIAKKGRAKNLQEKSRGHKDAGATSMSLIFKGFARGITR